MPKHVSRRELIIGRPRAGSERVHIASLLVQVKPDSRAELSATIGQLDAELHETANPHKFAVVLEGADERSIAEATTQLSQTPGVLTVSIVAHLIEEASALEEVIDDQSSSVSQA